MTLLDTGYLASLLLLSLILPMMLSLRNPQGIEARRTCLRTVLFGQAFLAVAGIFVLISSVVAPLAMTCGALSCGACVVFLHRQLRTTSAKGSPF